MAVSKNIIQSPTSNPLAAARDAAAVAQGLRNAATACTADQPALRTQLIVAAATIDALCELLIRAIAKKKKEPHQRAYSLTIAEPPDLSAEDYELILCALDLLDQYTGAELAKIGNNMKAAAMLAMRSRVLIVRGKVRALAGLQA